VFSGIVAGRGEVLTAVAAEGGRLALATTGLPSELGVGESVAVNGACLTIVERTEAGLAADVTPETVRRTNLAGLRAGDPVNLEPSLAYGERVGGHLVSGHVDAVGEVLEVRPDGGARWLVIALPVEIACYVVDKGCVAVDGISLTVAHAGADRFSVTLIPHTLAATTAAGWRRGSRVNLEADLLAKYVQRGLDVLAPAPAPGTRR
jgi:riboflavin synthase